MADLTHWNRPGSTGEWDRVKLGGKLLPGVATVEVKAAIAKLDVKKAKGKQKAKQTNEGPENAKVSIRLQLEPDEDLVRLKEVLPILRPSKERKPSEPQPIEHPNCAAADVATVVVENVTWSQPSAVNGWMISLECSEWVPQPKDSGGLGKGKGGGPKSCAQLAWEAQAAAEKLEQMRAEAQELKSKKNSGVLLKSSEAARLNNLEGKLQAQKNAFDAAVAAAERCAAAKPPSQSAKSNTI